MKPRIAIPVPTSTDEEYNGRCWPQYAAAVRAAGGEAVRLPLEDTSMRDTLMKGCAGFLLPGSPADVDPGLYGQSRHSATAASDPARERCDRRLLEDAGATGAPVLGICFGLQSMNVWMGGTLIQDLFPVPVNHQAGPQVALAHATLIVGQSLLGGLLSREEAPSEGQFRRLLVNSSHHQAVAILGEGLLAVGRSAQDGVVEAVEGRIGEAVTIGVQWHPERNYGTSAASKGLFAWLVMEAMDRAEHSGEMSRAHAL